MSFETFGLAAPLLRAVATEGYTTPTPIQAQAIPQVLAGHDVLGCAQTGTGKTAAFALPILHRLLNAAPAETPRGRPIRALVLSPTRELALQIHENFASYGRHSGLRQTVLFGGVSQHPQTQALRRGVDVLVATPGRLVDLIQQGFVDLRHVEIFVLDEADRMLDMGFIPDVRRVIARLPARRQTLFFSATMPTAVESLARTILSNPVAVRIAPVRATTELIEQSVYFLPKPRKIDLLVRYLQTEEPDRTLVFTRTKHGADRVAQQLSRVGIEAEAIHGNKSQGARQRTLANFKAQRTRIVIATDLAARGIDVEGISHVINFDLPQEAETYVHRIGRTGRAGATGVAVSFCDPEERGLLKAIERLTRRPLAVQDHPLAAGSATPAKTEAPATLAKVPQRVHPPQHGGGTRRPVKAGRKGAAAEGSRGRRRRPRGRVLDRV